jgi:hypothetical protein
MAAAASSGADVEVKGTRSGIIPLAPAVARGEPAKIGVSPDGEKIIYVNQNTVVVRDIADPSKAFIYGEHTAKVTGKFGVVNKLHLTCLPPLLL